MSSKAVVQMQSGVARLLTMKQVIALLDFMQKFETTSEAELNAFLKSKNAKCVRTINITDNDGVCDKDMLIERVIETWAWSASSVGKKSSKTAELHFHKLHLKSDEKAAKVHSRDGKA